MDQGSIYGVRSVVQMASMPAGNGQLARMQVAVLTALHLLFGFYAFMFGFEDAAREGGVLENLQVCILIANAVLFTLLAGCTWELPRLVFLGGLSLTLMILRREVDLPVDIYWSGLINEDFLRAAAFAPFVLIFVTYAIFRRDVLWDLASYLFSVRTWPFVAGLAACALAQLFEEFHDIFEVGHGWQFFEETFEASGYLMVFVAGMWFLHAALQYRAGLAKA